MPIYMQYEGIKGNVTDTLRQFSHDISIIPYPGAASLSMAVRRQHPGGVHGILIGLLPVPGYRYVDVGNGIIAVLIGLLLPAVQKMQQQGSSDVALLKGALKPGAGVNFVMADGSVRGGGGLVPTDQFSLNFTKINF